MARKYDLWSVKDFRLYLGEVKRKFGVVETLALPSMRDLPPVQIETLFVPPLLAKKIVNPDSDPENWPEGESLISIMEIDRQVVVLGDPGGGKTTLSNWLAWRMTAGISVPLPESLSNRIPLPCILREMPATCFEGDANLTLLARCILESLLTKEKAESVLEIFNEWIEDGQFVLILDGIDEISISRRKVVAGWIRESNKRGASVLATSRIVGYEDYPVDSLSVNNDASKLGESSVGDELAEAPLIRKMHSKRKDSSVGAAIETHETRWAKVRFLMPFDSIRISDFAHNWYGQRCVTSREAKQKTQDLLAALAQSEVTQKLARTPNLLSLMAIVHRERAHLPDGKALLYDEIVNAYLNTIDKQRKIGSDDILSQYGWKDRQSWISYVAFKMQDLRSSWSAQDSGLLASEEEVVFWLTTSMADTGVTSPEVVARDFLQWVARRSGLLLPRGEGQYAFVHLSFQEYFSARYLESSIVRPAFVKNKLPPGSLVTKARLKSWAESYPWLETLVFLFEILSIERDADWVEDLTKALFGHRLGGNFYGSLASLAARIIKNKHIKISEVFYNRLVDACCFAACSEWEDGAGSDFEVLKVFMATKHAVVIAVTDEDESAALGASLNGENLFERCDWEKVRVVLVRDSSIDVNSYLDKLPNLRALVINSSYDLDARGLRKSEGIRLLRVYHTNIKSASDLSNHKSIEQLELYSVDASAFDFLKALVNIRVLELSDLDISDIDFCISMPLLDSLVISNCPVTTLQPLKNAKYLSSLDLSKLACGDISFAGGLTNLLTLRVAGMPVEELPNLDSNKKLSSISLAETMISDLSALSGHPSLRLIFIRKSLVVDFNVLAKAPKLEVLVLSDTGLNSLMPLERCVKLKSLHMSNMYVEDLSPLSKLKNLRALILTGLPVKNVTALAKLSKLSYLQLVNTQVTDVAPLIGLKHLEVLRIDKDSQVDVSVLNGREDLSVTIIDNDFL